MGDNQVAFDAVCCHLIGVDPLSSITSAWPTSAASAPSSSAINDHRRRHPRRGPRPREGLQGGAHPRREVLRGHGNITAYAGPPPEPERTDYCWGGCPGAIEEAIEILRLYDAECDAKMPRTHVVFGAYDGPIDAKPGEKVVFIGDCSTYDGEVAGKLVQIRSTYKPRDTKDPHTIAHDDIFAKMASVMMKLRAAKGEQVVRFEGCPVSVAEQVLMLVFLSGAKNPFFEPGESLAFNKAYLQWRGTMAMKRLQGIPYQKPGPAPRGEAAPVLDAPADAE
jgi:hypothetical protein